MPRPHPPRKRPRRPQPSRRATRADVALTKQTADSSQPKTQAARPAPASQSAAAGQAAVKEQIWSRRSYAILMACVAGTQVVIGILLFLLAAQPKDATGLFAVIIGFQPLQPVPQLAASVLAAPLAKRLSGETRSLRFVETLMAGVIIYALFFILLVASQFVLTAAAPGPSTANSCGTNSTVPTPLAETPRSSPTRAGASPTPCPSPNPSASATRSPSPSPTPATGISTTNTAGTSLSASAVLGTFGVMDVLAYVLAVFIYPPVYQRLRYKPPPPRPKTAAKGKSK
jgi:hypothetical protein